MGQSPSSDAYNTEKKGLPFLQGCAEFGDKYPAPVKYCSIPLKVAQKGAVLVSVRAPVGDINIADQDYIIGRGLAAISGTSINQDLLPYLLDFVKPQLRQVAQGSTFEAISFDDLDKCLLPDLGNEKEQSKIAEVLTTIDRAITQTEALIAKHQRIKTGLMQDLLTRGIDEHGQLRDESTHKFKSTPLGMIPVEWEYCELDDLVDWNRPIVYGILMPGYGYPNGVPVVKVKDIYDDKIHTEELLLTNPAIDELYKRSRLKTGDLLFSIRGSVGRMAFVPTILDNANITQDTARISITKANSKFVRYFLDLSKVRDFVDLHTLGQAVKGINLRDVRRIPIAIPSPEEQERIIESIDKIFELIEVKQNELMKLSKLKTGLMQDLLSGEVSVTPLLEG